MRCRFAFAGLLGLVACTFSPSGDVELTTADGGAAPNPRDGGEIDGGGRPPDPNNRPPAAEAGDPVQALPWDTVDLDGTASSDPDADPLTYRWRIARAPDGPNQRRESGFAPFPGVAHETADGPRATLFVSTPGSWEIELLVSDGLATATDALVVEVNGFGALVTNQDVRDVAIRALDGQLAVATAEDGVLVFEPGALAGTVAPCSADGGDAATYGDAGELYLGAREGGRIDEVRPDGTCRRLEVSEDGRVFDLYAHGGALFAATERDLVVFDTTTGQGRRRGFDANGSERRYVALASDGIGHLWVGSGESPGRDGVFRTPLPHDPTVPRHDLFGGLDDGVTAIRPGAVDAGAGLDEIWIGTDRGLVYVPDASVPEDRHVWTTTSGELPATADHRIADVVLDPATLDVWVATATSLLRFKRDASVFVAVPIGSYGLPSGTVPVALAFDAAAARGRAIVLGGRGGAFAARAP